MTSTELLELAVETLDMYHKRSLGNGFPIIVSRTITNAQSMLIKGMLIVNSESKEEQSCVGEGGAIGG